MIDWVFLDVGNVLFIDDPQNFQGYRFVHELISKHHADYTFAEMLAEREKWALYRGRFHSQKNRPPAAAGNWIHKPCSRRCGRIWSSLTTSSICSMRARSTCCRSCGRGGGWESSPISRPNAEKVSNAADCSIFLTSSPSAMKLDLHKPDRRLYEWAIAQAGCDPARAVMVGDRRDNDIAPAKDCFDAGHPAQLGRLPQPGLEAGRSRWHGRLSTRATACRCFRPCRSGRNRISRSSRWRNCRRPWPRWRAKKILPRGDEIAVRL